MASAFSNLFAQARSVLRAHFGETISRTPVGGSAGNVTMNVLAESSVLMEDEGPGGGRIKFRTRVGQVYTDEVPVSRLGDTYVIAGETWTVRGIPSVDAGIATLLLQCPIKIEEGGRRLPR